MAQIYIAFVDTPGFFAGMIRQVIKQKYIHVVLSMDALVNRLAGQNRDEQLRRRAHARAKRADNHQHPIRLHILQDAQERALLLLELVGLHCTSLPFRNWLSWISR